MVLSLIDTTHPLRAQRRGPELSTLGQTPISGSLPSPSPRLGRLRSRDPPAAVNPLATVSTNCGAPSGDASKHCEGAHTMITTTQPVSTTPMHALTKGPGVWPLSLPVAHMTRVPLRCTISTAQALRAWSKVLAAHPPTGCSSYDLLPDETGIVVWAVPCHGFADPEATHLGTILLAPPPATDTSTVGSQSEIVGLLVAPPYSVADLLAHVRALFGVQVGPVTDQPSVLRQ